MQGYAAIIEGSNHSLERVPKDYQKITLFWQWKDKLEQLEKTDTYQRRNILIYYCIFMISIPIILYRDSISFLWQQPRTFEEHLLCMPITYDSDKDIIVYALEKIITYAWNIRYIFLAQSIWWISLVIAFQQGLVVHIDNLRLRRKVPIKESHT
jgi:hypothetical protein